MLPIKKFAEIKKKTRGLLEPRAYQAIYQAAKEAPEGVAVDVGPAQGATTISLALGWKEAGKTGRIFAVDAFRGSSALKSKDVEQNKKILRANVESYAPAGPLRILQAGKDDLLKEIGKSEIAILVIDADGALDRDFTLFYDRLVPGAYIIIDNYELKYADSYTGYTDEQLRQYVDSKGLKRFRDANPLGKHYTVFRFTNYFLEKGLLTIENVHRHTAFCRKPSYAPMFRTPNRAVELEAIREDIEKQFMAKRKPGTA